MDKTSNSTTVPAISTISLEDLIERFRAAETVMNGLDGDPLGSTEEVEFNAAMNAIDTTTVSAKTFDGALDALRLAIDETSNFETTHMIPPLLKGCLAFFENLQTVSGESVRNAVQMASGLDLRKVEDKGFVAIYDALSSCIETIVGVTCQPRCGDESRMNAAGEYLDTLSDFLMFELRSAMYALADLEIAPGSDPEFKNSMLLQWMARDGDMNFAEIAAAALKMDAEQQAYQALKVSKRGARA